jgi:hypothetical protein
MPTCAHLTSTPGEGCFGSATLGLVDITERPEFSSGYTQRLSQSCDQPQPFHASRLTARSALGCRRQKPAAQVYPLFTMSWIDPRPAAPTRKLVLFNNEDGGARRDRTDDLKLAKLPLSQLSYGPNPFGIVRHFPESPTPQRRRRNNGGPGKI